MTCFPGRSTDKESACNVGDMGSISGLRRSPGGGQGNPPQYSCLENHQGERSLACCHPWGLKELDTTEQLSTFLHKHEASLVTYTVKESARSAGDPGLVPGLGRSPGEENGNPLQYSCLENPTDRGAWGYSPGGHQESWTRLSNKHEATAAKSLGEVSVNTFFRV